MSALVQCLITHCIQFFPSSAEDQIKAEYWRRLLSVAVSLPERIRISLVNESGYFWNKKADLKLKATESFAYAFFFLPPSNCLLSLILLQSSGVMPGSLFAKYFTDYHSMLFLSYPKPIWKICFKDKRTSYFFRKKGCQYVLPGEDKCIPFLLHSW